jgi:hypothetical protein
MNFSFTPCGARAANFVSNNKGMLCLFKNVAKNFYQIKAFINC